MPDGLELPGGGSAVPVVLIPGPPGVDGNGAITDTAIAAIVPQPQTHAALAADFLPRAEYTPGETEIGVDNLTDATALGRQLARAADAAAARAAIGAGTSSLTIGITGTTAAAGNDTRLSDQRVPADGSVSNAKVAAGAAIALSKLATDPLARANHTGTQTSASIADLTEAVQDIVGVFFGAGTGAAVTYDDTANTITVSATGTTDPEAIRDTIGAALIGVGNISVAVNDATDTITVSTTATTNATDAALRDRATHTGTQSADTITDGATNKAFLDAERTKLAGIAAGATANATDAALRDRATHTGTQPASTVTGLAAVATTGAYGDLTGKPTIPAGYTDEQAQDAAAALLAAGTHTGITFTYNDAAGALSAATAAVFQATVTDYVTPGSYTYTIPAGAAVLELHAIAGGTGGGGGSRNASTTAHSGGSGAGGSAYTVRTVAVADLGGVTTLPVVVGAGGVGGATAPNDAAAGGIGGVGGESSVGTLIRALAGTSVGGSGGGTSNGQAGAGMFAGSTGGSSSSTTGGNAGAAVSGGGGGGGGGGGSLSAAGALLTFGAGSASNIDGRTAATTAGAAGTAGMIGQPGLGGAGGAASTSGPASPGGDGGWPGGGGGGGGASVNGQLSGRGGAGGGGAVRIVAR